MMMMMMYVYLRFRWSDPTRSHPKWRDMGRVRCLPDDKDSSSSGPKMPFDVARTTKILRDVT